ncbi:MAG: hypothetical protein HYW57_02180 [Ignavibacteriales bacterium]|nr:hypothetical protein [Ignavibacteriales bacterium]
MKVITLLGCGIIAVLALSCSAAKEGTDGKEAQMPKPAEPGPGVPPNHCRIIGTIVSIDEMLAPDTDDPCSKAPCVATVRIDEVLGYGSGFIGMIGSGKEIKVRFQTTLAPTRDILPHLMPALPGLQSGSRFQADLRGSGPPMMEGQEDTYSVNHYEPK